MFVAANPKDGSSVELDDSLRPYASDLEHLSNEIKRLESERQRVKNEIIHALGAATEGRFSDGSGFTHRMQTRAATITKESTFPVLRASAKPSKRKAA